MDLALVTLDDKYTQQSGRVFLTAMQALVRLPVMQRQRDLAAGLDTAGYISGYRGSPLGGYDSALWRARDYLNAHNIVFQPGVNEELAGTAVWGSQQANAFPGAKYDGVFGIWYGKGPGVDRCGDVFKHANFAGTSPHGGVLALAGDDHGAKSSTVAHQSDQAFIAAMMPILNPASVQDIIDFGLYGWALSRFSGCWVGLKLVSETAESTATVDIGPERINIVTPNDVQIPEGGMNIRPVDGLAEPEARIVQYKLPAVEAFVRANQIDRVVVDGPRARLGVASAGKSYMDVRQALDELGLSERDASDLGLRLYKIGMSWPLEPIGAQRFAEGLEEILVVEEKRPVMENQFAQLLYNSTGAARPRLIGKRGIDGDRLLPEHGELDPIQVAIVIGERLLALGGPDSLGEQVEKLKRRSQDVASRSVMSLQRTPYFCSGCPHNTSTLVPDGSVALAGIGCHAMAAFRPERNTRLFTQMGGEGANWIGQAPFTETGHVFQNLGDGTYYHSGLMAIRAAIASGVNITYKILYNDAVAMTGGQPLDGQLSVGDVTRQVNGEGAAKVVVVSDDPDKFGSDAGLASGVTVYHRDDLNRVQRELREIPGVTVLVYEQTCAAEKRRRRKRNLFPDPPKRVFINDLVCEGCGDCNLVSNCVSVKPEETELGRKRRIDQSSCNKDYSCVKGFCPSIVTVHGGGVRKPAAADVASAQTLFDSLPDPKPLQLNGPYNVLVTGIGGTGVVTIGAFLGMAAHLEGKATTILDQTGLAQKNGAVISHVRLAMDQKELHGTRIAAMEADLVIGCDIVVAAGVDALARIGTGRTRAAINSHVEPTASFIFDPDLALAGAPLKEAISAAAGEGRSSFVDAAPLATALMGDSIATNPFMVGYAYQLGALPLSNAAILKAIELNGIAVESNQQAFQWGRFAAHDPEKISEIAAPLMPIQSDPPAVELNHVVARRSDHLKGYQNTTYAARYRKLIERVAATERTAVPGKDDLALAVARNYFKLLAYKDEYEVARLYTDGRFMDKIRSQFEGDITLRFHLAPPLLAVKDPETGHLTKREYGPWALSAFKVLARLKGLRGTLFDPFGHTEERRTERRLIRDYEALIEKLLTRLNQDNHHLAVRIASLPDHIRGFGHVKEAAIEQARSQERELLAAFESNETRSAAAE